MVGCFVLFCRGRGGGGGGGLPNNKQHAKEAQRRGWGVTVYCFAVRLGLDGEGKGDGGFGRSGDLSCQQNQSEHSGYSKDISKSVPFWPNSEIPIQKIPCFFWYIFWAVF